MGNVTRKDLYPAFNVSLGKTLAAAAWVDGDLNEHEMDCLKAIVLQLPYITFEDWRKLKIYLAYPISPPEQKSIINDKKNRIEKIDSQISLNNPIRKLDLIKNKLIQANERLHRNINEKIMLNKNLVDKLLKNIEILSPLSILDRGYAIVTNKKGKAIKSFSDVSKGEILKTRLNKGSLDVEVIKNEK